MLNTRGWKYRVFLRYLKLFKYLAFAPKRGEFLESYYTLMRYIDDVLDGTRGARFKSVRARKDF